MRFPAYLASTSTRTRDRPEAQLSPGNWPSVLLKNRELPKLAVPSLDVNRSVTGQLLGPFDGLCLRVVNSAGPFRIRLANCPPLIVNFYKDFIVTMAAHT
jgi:hypothetical protein